MKERKNGIQHAALSILWSSHCFSFGLIDESKERKGTKKRIPSCLSSLYILMSESLTLSVSSQEDFAGWIGCVSACLIEGNRMSSIKYVSVVPELHKAKEYSYLFHKPW